MTQIVEREAWIANLAYFYVRTIYKRKPMGTADLRSSETLHRSPVMIGTWMESVKRSCSVHQSRKIHTPTIREEGSWQGGKCYEGNKVFSVHESDCRRCLFVDVLRVVG